MLNVDEVVRIKVFGAYTATPFDRLLNVLHYRVQSIVDQEDVPPLEAVCEAFVATKLDRWIDNLPTTYQILQVRAQVVYPPATSYEAIRNLTALEGTGTLDQVGPSSQTAAACITRRSYKPGRKGIGRVFFGPLHSAFINGDLIVQDPTLDGDLRDVVSSLGEDLTVNQGSLRPCLFGGPNESGSPVDAQMDIRTQEMAALVSYMRTRRRDSL